MSTTDSPAPQENQLVDRQAFLDAERAKWLSIREAAYVLGTSHTTIHRMIRSQALPHRREGKVVRIHLDDLRPQPAVREVSHAGVLAPEIQVAKVAATASGESALDAARRRFDAARKAGRLG